MWLIAVALIVAPVDAERIGDKIWKNESQGRADGLTCWNPKEEFASLGIGHFIWYPENTPKVFEEQFPIFLKFVHSKGITLPSWLEAQKGCPWQTRNHFLNDLQSPKMIELRSFLLSTIGYQAEFMIQRATSVLEKMKACLNPAEKEHIEKIFAQIEPYALIDYLNFKGDGTCPSERYCGQGWGLMQVLLHMPQETPHPTQEFVKSAKVLLLQRVENSPPERQEKKYLEGWFNRLNTYLENS